MGVGARQWGRWLVGVLGAFFLVFSSLMTTPLYAANRVSLTPIQLRGAGSTFDYPFFQVAFMAYSKQFGVTINYQAVGSSAGIEQFIANRVDFGASDVPMDSTQVALASVQGRSVAQIPVALGGVSIAYNLPGVTAHLRFDGATLARIFLGTITDWDDPAIAALNPGVHLPHLPIVPVHRSDGSGTSYIFTDYLSTVIPTWFSRVGRNTLPAWPVGLGGQGNGGVASVLKAHPGGIAYLELSYAIENGIPYARVKNKAGVFMLPTAQSILVAGTEFPDINSRHYSIVNAPEADAYPICGYSWVLLRRPLGPHGAALVALFHWLTTTGQQYAAQVHYVPLPPNVQQLATTIVTSLKQY
jgi:phosphate transport system substrate-binding protein